MAIINLYRNLDLDKREIVKAESGKSLSEIIKNIDWENSLVIVNGNNAGKNYLIKDDDIISIKQYPSSDRAKTIGAGIALDFLVPGLGTIIQVDQAIKDIEQTPLKDSLQTEDLSVNNIDVGQTETLPSISGASNQSANGKPIPYIMGKTLMTPYIIGKAYSTISGEDGENQYLTYLLELGYSDMLVQDVRIGNFKVASNAGGELPSGNFLTIDGNFRFTQGGENTTQIELRNDSSEMSLYPQKVTQNNYSERIIHTPQSDDTREHILKLDKFTDINPQKVEVEISFNKLFKIGETEQEETSVKIGIAVSYDDGHTWEPFGQITGSNSYTTQNVVLDDEDVQAGISGTIGVSTIKRNKNKNLRFVASKEFTYSEIINSSLKTALIRVVRINPESLDTSIQDVAYLSAIRTWCFDRKKSLESTSLIPQVPVIPRIRNKITRMAIKIKATDFIKGMIGKTTCILTGKCKTWDGTSWSAGKNATQNPASIILDIMKNSMLGKNKYPDTLIDYEQAGVLYDFCEEKNIKINGVLTGQKKLREVISIILKNCRSALILKGNKYSFWIDKPKTIPVTIMNNHNILDEGISNNKNFDVLPDAYLVSFIDEENNYTEGQFYVPTRENVDLTSPDTLIQRIEYTWITNYQQAYKQTLYLHAVRKLRPETWSRKQGIEGNIAEVGDLVEFQDDTISVGIGDGGEITDVDVQNGFIVSITTDAYFNIADITKEYAVKLNTSNGTRTDRVTFEENGYLNKFYFVTPVSLDDLVQYHIGDIVSFGIFGKVTVNALVMGKKQNQDQTFDFSLVPYQEGIYTADAGIIPEYDPKTTSSQPIVNTPPIPVDIGKIPAGRDGRDGKDGKSGIMAFPEKSALVYDADNNGVVSLQTITDRIRIEQEGIPVPFTIGTIISPAGFEITSVGSIVTITALQGSAMAKNGVIRIPINYSPVINSYDYVNENGDCYVNENDNVYTYVESSSIVLDTNLYVSYAKSIKGNTGLPGRDGEPGEPGEPGDRGARYWGTEKPTIPVKGDYYLDITTLTLKEFDSLIWKDIPFDDDRWNVAIPDVIAYIDMAGTEQTVIVNAWVSKLVAGTVLADKIFTKSLVLKEGGFIKSNNYIENKKGFKVDTNGIINANEGSLSNIEVRSDIYSQERQSYLGLYSADYGQSRTESGVLIRSGFNLSSQDGNGRLDCGVIKTDMITKATEKRSYTSNPIWMSDISVNNIIYNYGYDSYPNASSIQALKNVFIDYQDFFEDSIYYTRVTGGVKTTNCNFRFDNILTFIKGFILVEEIKDDYFMELQAYSYGGNVYFKLDSQGRMRASGPINNGEYANEVVERFNFMFDTIPR